MLAERAVGPNRWSLGTQEPRILVSSVGKGIGGFIGVSNLKLEVAILANNQSRHVLRLGLSRSHL